MVILFNTVVYMSWISLFVGLFLMIIRWGIGRKLPAIVRYALWMILLFRLIIPGSLSSETSLFNLYPVTVSKQVVNKGFDKYNKEENVIFMNQNTQVNEATKQIKIYDRVALIWGMGVIGLMSLFILTYVYMMNKFREAILCRKVPIDEASANFIKKEKIRIYSLEGLKTPVVCGVFKPRIIIPTCLVNSENEIILKNVIRHEIVHIQRKDYLVKLVALFIACIHWFNPIVWRALILVYRDMEQACDEKVVQGVAEDIRREYAQSLLSFAIQKPEKENIVGVAFGESNTKKRIKGILKYKRPNVKIKLLSCVVFIVSIFLIATDASIQIQSVRLESLKQQKQEMWAELDEVSTNIIEVAIVSQDKNFNKHNGIDITAMIRAGFNNLSSNAPKQGGSTITQQLVRNICDFGSLGGIGKKRSEIYTAIELEKNYSKEEILEAYLNSIAFGNDIIGIKKACSTYFSKQPLEVTREEAAQLMAIVDNPSRYNPISQKENNGLKAQMILEQLNEMTNN